MRSLPLLRPGVVASVLLHGVAVLLAFRAVADEVSRRDDAFDGGPRDVRLEAAFEVADAVTPRDPQVDPDLEAMPVYEVEVREVAPEPPREPLVIEVAPPPAPEPEWTRDAAPPVAVAPDRVPVPSLAPVRPLRLSSPPRVPAAAAPVPRVPVALEPRVATAPARAPRAYVPSRAVSRPGVTPRDLPYTLVSDVEVGVQFRVATDGSVEGAFVVHSSGASVLDEAALASVRAWRFAPATLDGVAVAETVRSSVRFRPRIP